MNRSLKQVATALAFDPLLTFSTPQEERVKNEWVDITLKSTFSLFVRRRCPTFAAVALTSLIFNVFAEFFMRFGRGAFILHKLSKRMITSIHTSWTSLVAVSYLEINQMLNHRVKPFPSIDTCFDTRNQAHTLHDIEYFIHPSSLDI